MHHFGPEHPALDLLLGVPAEHLHLVVHEDNGEILVQHHHGRARVLHGGTILGFARPQGLLRSPLGGNVPDHVLSCGPALVLDDRRSDLEGPPYPFFALECDLVLLGNLLSPDPFRVPSLDHLPQFGSHEVFQTHAGVLLLGIAQKLPELGIGVLETVVLVDKDPVLCPFHQNPVLLLRLPELFLDRLDGPQVTEHAEGCHGPAVLVHIGDRKGYGYEGTVLDIQGGLLSHEPARCLCGSLVQDGHDPLPLALLHEGSDGNLVFQELFGTVTGDLFGRLVEEKGSVVQVGSDDGVAGIRNEAAQELIGRLQLLHDHLPIRDVTGDVQGGGPALQVDDRWGKRYVAFGSIPCQEDHFIPPGHVISPQPGLTEELHEACR
mgnify:CR=1 FL=1